LPRGRSAPRRVTAPPRPAPPRRRRRRRRSQHCFIDPSSPGSNHGLAYNCVGCPDNQMSFNDGYHILHHHNSQVRPPPPGVCVVVA
jgi:hypothetical protein